MKKIILPLLTVSLLWACTSENKDKKVAHVITAENDTLTYRYDSVKVVSNNLVKLAVNKQADTANAIVRYPVFENDSLNNYIKSQVLHYFGDEEMPTAFDDIASSFIRGYNEFYLENPGTAQWWYLLIDIKVIRQLHNYIALKYIHSDYAGGAHGNTVISYINFNPKTNQAITVDSLILPDKKVELLKIGERIFRSNENISATESLEKRYFFTNGKFSLPKNFYVSNKGLVFLYNPYEIKPYADGTTELVIPFSELSGIAKPQTILTPNQ
ncbi:DUF3298 and DUF4163 domain-containing protein [Pedobacter sp.]